MGNFVPDTCREVLYVRVCVNPERGTYRMVKLAREIPRATMVMPGDRLPLWRMEGSLDCDCPGLIAAIAELAEGQLIDLDAEGSAARAGDRAEGASA